MTNRNGRGRLNRGENCNETAHSDRMSRRRDEERHNPRGRPRYRNR